MNLALHILGVVALMFGPILIPAAKLAWGGRDR
jgi:hypothetical protein